MRFYEHMAVAARTYLVEILQQNKGRAYDSMEACGMQKDAFYGTLKALGLKCEDFRPIRHHAVCPEFKYWIGRAIQRGARPASR